MSPNHPSHSTIWVLKPMGLGIPLFRTPRNWISCNQCYSKWAAKCWKLHWPPWNSASFHIDATNLTPQRDSSDGKALKYYHLAIQCNPRFAQSLNNLGVAYTTSGRLTEVAERWWLALWENGILNGKSDNKSMGLKMLIYWNCLDGEYYWSFILIADSIRFGLFPVKFNANYTTKLIPIMPP